VKQGPGVDDVLMPSTPLAYPQVDRGCFASFRVVKSSISAVQAILCAWFDSRQLHREGPDLEQQVSAFSLSMG
jgi:hypothetical protein